MTYRSPHLDNDTEKIVSANSELFVAVCKFKKHSFLMVGVHDKASNERHILFSLGKTLAKNECLNHFRFFLGGAPSVIRENDFVYTPNARDISYKAFAISDEQYEQLIGLVIASKHKTSEADIYAFRLETQADGRKTYTLNNLSASKTSTTADEIDKSICTLTLRNNCRKTAMQFLDAVLDSRYKGNDISSNPLTELPFTTTIYKGKFFTALYILPSPPSCKNCSTKQYQMLARIYRQLEKLPKKCIEDKVTKKSSTN